METEDERPFSFSLLTEVHCIRSGLSTYVDLSHEVEALLDAREEEIGKRLEDTLKRVPKSKHQEVHESFALDFRTYEDTFRFLQREAMFLTLYNYFEYFLNKLCDAVGEEITSRVRLRDIQGKGIERALLFLKLVPQFEFAKIPAAMDVIRGANQLRNVIVHAGTALPVNANQKVNQFVASHPHLCGNPGAQVSLEKEFVPSFAATLTQFFDEFDKEMQRYAGREGRANLSPS